MKNLLAKIRKSEKSVIEKWKKVHIEWKRFCLYRNEEYIVPQRKGGGFRYIYIPLDATIEVLQAKAENIFSRKVLILLWKNCQNVILDLLPEMNPWHLI